MRKKTFLKAVSLFACLSILMLSVPGVIAAEKTPKKNDSFIKNYVNKLSMLLPFLNLKVNDKGGTSSDQTYNDNSKQKIKITGTLTLVKGPKSGD